VSFIFSLPVIGAAGVLGFTLIRYGKGVGRKIGVKFEVMYWRDVIEGQTPDGTSGFVLLLEL
jgi:hypothetical protein